MPTISLHEASARPYKQELQATSQTVVFNVPPRHSKKLIYWHYIDNIALGAVVLLMSVDGIVEEEILHLSTAEHSKHQLSSPSLEFEDKNSIQIHDFNTAIVLDLCKVSANCS